MSEYIESGIPIPKATKRKGRIGEAQQLMTALGKAEVGDSFRYRKTSSMHNAKAVLFRAKRMYAPRIKIRIALDPTEEGYEEGQHEDKSQYVRVWRKE